MLFHSYLGLQIGYLTASCSHEIRIFLPKWISREFFLIDIIKIVTARKPILKHVSFDFLTIDKFRNK